MAILDALRRRAGDTQGELIDEMRVNYERVQDSLTLYQERIAELELALEDEGFTQLGLRGRDEFSREGLDKLVGIARITFLKNPLIHRGVMVQTYYVFGQSLEITSNNDEIADIATAFWDEAGNRAELTGAQALELKEIELQITGNVFLTLFTKPDTGDVRVRSIPLREVRNILTNPEDRKEPRFYVRRWIEQRLREDGTGNTEPVEHVALYPDWRYRPNEQPAMIGGLEVRWDSPVYHVKTGGLEGMRFGLPDVYAAIDWARAYKDCREDWATIVRALSRFAWKMSGAKGGKKGRAAARDKLQTTLTRSKAETNPPPTTGATFVSSEGVDLTPIPKTGATVAAEDGRQLRLMVAAALDIPDTILSGDPDMGNLATAKTLDRPTELAMRSRQTLWRDVFSDLLSYVIREKIRARQLPGEVEDDQLNGEIIVPPADEDYSITVTFPPILEHDVAAAVKAIVTAATLDGKPQAGTMPTKLLVELLLTALGVEGIKEITDEMDLPEGSPEPATAAEAQFLEAARDLQGLLEKMGSAA